MDVDLEELAAIIELLDKTEFTDFRFEKGELKIAVRRGGLLPLDVAADSPEFPDAAPNVAAPNVASPTVASPAVVRPSVAPIVAPTPGDPPVATEGRLLVISPMLGTFYRAAKPGESSFVEIGDTVGEDATLCIIEVMKLMSSVPAGVAGEVTAIFASDGDLVEYGQPLFEIRPLA